MLRRPPGEGRLVAQKPKVLLALAAVLFLSWLPVADAQQQHPQQHSAHQVPAHVVNGGVPIQNQQYASYEEPAARRAARNLKSPFEGDRAAHTNPIPEEDDGTQRPLTAAPPHGKRPNYHNTIYNKNSNNKYNQIPTDASALATLAPAVAVRAPNVPGHLPSMLAGAGFSSLQSARSLDNWEVEDYVLLATIDGYLHAIDRNTGVERWNFGFDEPIVETIHHRINSSVAPEGHLGSQKGPDAHPLNDYIWAVEPSRHGAVYFWTPEGLPSGLVSTGFTMKGLVDDLGPYAVQQPPVVYMGHKQTTLVTIDAATGMPLQVFGQGPSAGRHSSACVHPNGSLADATGSKKCKTDGFLIISRTEYTVTIHDAVGGDQIATLKYLEWGPNQFDSDLHQQHLTAHDDQYISSRTDGRLYSISPDEIRSLGVSLSVPVAHVFDIARPLDTPTETNPELVLLPQPIPPITSEESAELRSQRVFLNQTETGDWYALSGLSYPLILDTSSALLSQGQWWDNGTPWGISDLSEIAEALVGTHTLGNPPRQPQFAPGGSSSQDFLAPGLPSEPHNPPEIPEPEYPPELPGYDGSSLGEFTADTLLNKAAAIPPYVAGQARDFFTNPFWILAAIFVLFKYRRDFIRQIKHRTTGLKIYDDSINDSQPFNPPLEIRDAEPVDHQDPDAFGPQPEQATVENSAGVAAAPGAGTESPQEEAAQGSDQPAPGKKKKKAHRGTRGGQKHKKGAKKARDQSETRGDSASAGIDEMIPSLKNVGMPTKLEPNVTTVNNDPEDVSGPIVKIGGIEVNQEEELGMGSNGTVVFAGKFHGRDVAVKRMLTQFWDIASQETQLLLESDHHPNVIRYYAMSRNDSFLYIALELCQASLSDVIDKSHLYPALAQAGEMDMPRVLLQIAHGLSFLHDLRIVHRDLKPQNILVTMGRDGKPRLLVSDFGLCKKLEGGQSSFGATTAHAAGTSGWRAPELLVDDDARESSTSMASTHSDSSQLISSDMMPNRRATRSIDIFSLGLVFFYVLTKGSHPFDCGDRYMREVNIRKGQFNLQPLDALGDVANEAKALIETMLRSDPRARPSARDVMAHPFFWSPKERLAFLCDVSDHFELEPRDPPSKALETLENFAPKVCRGDFLKILPKEFVDSLGKQRKYTGARLLDLLRALRNKRFHYGDLSDSLKKMVGPVPEGYLGFWTRRFPSLLIVCCQVVYSLHLESTDTFKEYFRPRTPL